MKFFALVVTAAVVTGCGGGLFSSRPVSKSNLIGAEQTGTTQVDTASSRSGGNQVDGAASGSSNKNDAAANGTSASIDGSETATPTAAGDALAKALEKCPAADPAILDALIKSGQPFEVECEVEIEVGPDTDD